MNAPKPEKLALYFGCRDELGHYLQTRQKTIWRTEEVPGLPWTLGAMDGGLLANGKRPDVCDGKVFWTCGGRAELWFAFFWWDRSIDKRGASNSGFYVRGFDFADREAAFAYAGTIFPKVILRQEVPLTLQP